MLILYDNAFGDRGLAALLAPPHAGALARLASLDLDNCPVGDAGCAALAAALGCAEAMPALSELSLGTALRRVRPPSPRWSRRGCI